jgi:hypothetical protein
MAVVGELVILGIRGGMREVYDEFCYRRGRR